MNILLQLMDLIVILVALFLIGWYLIHRFRVRNIEPNGNVTAFSTLKALMIFFLIVLALGVVAFLSGSLVWFGLGYFVPDISDDLRMNLASTASTILCLILLVGRPLSVTSTGGEK